MSTFHEELERRTEQFEHYLELMRQRRAVRWTRDAAFSSFQERLDTDDPEVARNTESEALVYQPELEVAGWDDRCGTSGLDETVVIDLPDEGWRGDNSRARFIQFSFNPPYFDIDIPNTTLYRAEAEIILRRRSGFFYVKDRPQFEHPTGRAEEFVPLRKAYVYGDERSAPEDMAYVWFNVWHFPVDWRFFVKAAAFFEDTDWERGFRLSR